MCDSAARFYDLRADSGEFTNLAVDPKYANTCRELHELLVGELGEEPDDTEKRCLADFTKGYER